MYNNTFRAIPSDGLEERFLTAQNSTYTQALKELKAGKKLSHWIWYIFPQLRGLGRSDRSFYYGLTDLQEAQEYLAHPVLGSRLEACCQALLEHKNQPIKEIMGAPDAIKLRSSMTLFAAASLPGSLFHQVLDTFYDSEDPRTRSILLSQQIMRP